MPEGMGEADALDGFEFRPVRALSLPARELGATTGDNEIVAMPSNDDARGEEPLKDEVSSRCTPKSSEELKDTNDPELVGREEINAGGSGERGTPGEEEPDEGGESSDTREGEIVI